MTHDTSASKTDTLVVGAGQPEYIRTTVEKILGQGKRPALLLPERDRGAFTDLGCPIIHFRGRIRWHNPAFVRAVATYRAQDQVVVCGRRFDHNNVFAALATLNGLIRINPTYTAVVKDEERPITPDTLWFREIGTTGLLLLAGGLMRLMRPLVTIRTGEVYSTRIGHMAMDMENYLCERDLGMLPKRTLDILYPKNGIVCNETLGTLFRKTIRFSTLGRYLNRASSLLPGHDAHQIIMGVHRNYSRDPDGLFARTSVHLDFSPEDRRKGQAVLGSLGCDPDKPYVCLLGRDSAYLDTVYPGNDDGVDSRCRNMNIRDFLPSADTLTETGYSVLRVGSHVHAPLQSENPAVIDYANSGAQNQFMDIYLPANCAFFVGVPSGLIHIANIFRRPCVYVNLVRLEHIPAWDQTGITLFKRIRIKSENRFMTVREVVTSGAGRWPIERYNDPSLELVDNSPDEIRAAAMEMHQRLAGTWVETPEDLELQTRFWAHIPQSDLNRTFDHRVGAQFLRDHPELLD